MSRVRVDREQGATFVELFFDLVFVYAITQLTSLVLHDLTWSGVGRAALLFWLVWWAWTQFTWTLNLADTEHVWVRLPTLAATAVAFFLAQAVPDAFGDGGAWFAISYVLVRVLGLAVQEWVYRGDAHQVETVSVWARASSVGLVLVLIGGLVGPDLRLWLWGAAVIADIVAAEVAGSGTWQLVSGHFAERHGLIVIIALGESLIAAGVATAEVPRGVDFALTTTGAVVAACALWWTYFGVLHPRLEVALDEAVGGDVGRFARDVFSLWHAAVVAGVIGIAVGFEEAIAHPDEHLHADAALALSLGLVLFIGGLTGAAWRAGVREVLIPRMIVLALVVLTIPVVPAVAPAVALWGVALLAAGLAVDETRRLSEGARLELTEA